MEVQKEVNKKTETHIFCDLCKCETEIHGCVGTSGEQCQLCKICYNLLRIELLRKNARFTEIKVEPSLCSMGFHSWTHPNDQGHMYCLNCHAYQFDAEQARLHAHDPNVR